MVKLSPAKTFLGQPLSVNVAYFSSRGPNSIAPAILKPDIAAWKNGPSGSPIFAHGASQKLADPFDLGGGVVNPNKAADSGLVYDMTTADYIHYLCAMSYSNSAISRLTGKPTMCAGEKPSILDVNVPSITIPSLGNSTTITRTVTNVGGATKSIYKAAIEPPFGILVSVNPEVLVYKTKLT